MFEITRLKMIDIIHQCMMNRSVPVIPSATAPWANGHDIRVYVPSYRRYRHCLQLRHSAEALSRTEALLAEEHLLTPAA